MLLVVVTVFTSNVSRNPRFKRRVRSLLVWNLPTDTIRKIPPVIVSRTLCPNLVGQSEDGGESYSVQRFLETVLILVLN